MTISSDLMELGSDALKGNLEIMFLVNEYNIDILTLRSLKFQFKDDKFYCYFRLDKKLKVLTELENIKEKVKIQFSFFSKESKKVLFENLYEIENISYDFIENNSLFDYGSNNVGEPINLICTFKGKK